MKKIVYTITDELGIHARPAGLLVKEAAKFESNVKLIKGEKEVDAKRIIGVMSLGTKQGETITLEIEGNDEEDAYTALDQLLKEAF